MIDTLLELTSEALGIHESEITNIRPVGGMTNVSYGITVHGESYIVRLPGVGTDEFINRHEEKKNLKIGTSLGINPEEIFFDVDKGLKITRMIPGAQTLTIDMTKKYAIMKAVTQILKTLHGGPKKMENDFKLYELMDQYEEIARNENVEFYPNFNKTKKDMRSIKLDYERLDFLKAPTHIDALYQNFIQDENGKVYLIDWEYSGMFDSLWDIATHMMESGFSVAEEKVFLKLYFGRDVTEQEEQRIMIHKIFQDYLWCLWTLFKEAKGDNFGSYGEDRYKRLEKNIAFYEERYRQKMSV